MTSRAAVFRDIYLSNAWNGDGTPAGPGSSLAATVALRAWLPAILQQLGARSVLDAGCNDALWMPELPGYIGVDIVPDAIARARREHPDRSFAVADICTDDLPSCDAVICRDAFQHLSLADGLAAIANFRRTGAQWLLASTHRAGENPARAATGGYYPADLQAPPFSMGEPIDSLPDGRWDSGVVFPAKYFGVWEL